MRDEDADVDLLDLLGSGTDESLMSRYGRWYIPERDPRYLRRNALMALGNVARRLSARGSGDARPLPRPRRRACSAPTPSGPPSGLAARTFWHAGPICGKTRPRSFRMSWPALSEVPVRSTCTGH